MIITRTPFRVSFAGGGSDLASFYGRHEGCVVSTSINKYMYITIHPSFNREMTSIKYSQTENVTDIREIKHPIAKQLLLDYDIKGIEVSSTADVPAGTGLSTSSAFTVGLINALTVFKGEYVSQEAIAKRACEIEIEELGEQIGKQDQYGCAVGGLKFIRFLSDGSVDVEPIVLSSECKAKLSDNLLLFYTGITHSAGEVLQEQSKNMINDEDSYKNMVMMTDLAKDMRIALIDGDLSKFGNVLNTSWQLKRKLASKITNEFIDNCYDLAIKSGASGGKLLGAGGGGFLMFYCEKEKQKHLRSALNTLVELPFNLEYSGTKAIYVGD
jgi:D-glycero-alpha-D-manno-heptose-7-phosphate kinase